MTQNYERRTVIAIDGFALPLLNPDVLLGANIMSPKTGTDEVQV
jgi:hypothetical protein